MFNQKISNLFIVVTLLMICLIWGSSLQPVEQSREASTGLMELVVEILPGDIAESENLHHYIRKIAHLTEFAILAIVAYLACFFRGYTKKSQVVYLLYFGILIALGDELIQTQVDGRGPQVTDIAIDHIGFILGIIFTTIGIRCYRYYRKTQQAESATYIQ